MFAGVDLGQRKGIWFCIPDVAVDVIVVEDEEDVDGDEEDVDGDDDDSDDVIVVGVVVAIEVEEAHAFGALGHCLHVSFGCV